MCLLIRFFIFFIIIPVVLNILDADIGGYFQARFPEIELSVEDFSLHDILILISYVVFYLLFSVWLSVVSLAGFYAIEKNTKKINSKILFFGVAVIVFYSVELLNFIKFPNTKSSPEGFFVDIPFDFYLGAFISLFFCLIFFVASKEIRYRKLYIFSFLIPSLLSGSNIAVGYAQAFGSPQGVNSLGYIIGVDAVRSDASSLMVNNSNYMKANHIAFKNAWTPVGRTYASWNVLTTGENPENNNIRFNLSSNTPKCTLFEAFKSNGWNIIYGSDEKRFNHLGEKCSIKNNVGPPPSALDFLLSSPSLDISYFNLISEFDYLLYKLLPFHVHNRANAITFDPISSASFYAKQVKMMLEPGNNLLVFHFTLPHLPWTYKDYSYSPSGFNNVRYRDMVKVAGEMLDTFTGLLRPEVKQFSGLIWSDHGETFTTSHDDHVFCCSSIGGHGTSVDMLEQYNNFISFSFDIANKIKYKENSFVTSMDILPTISDYYLGQPIGEDGCNLLTIECNLKRELRLETGYTVSEMLKKSPDMTNVIKQGLMGYEIKKGRVTLKPEYERLLINDKKFNKVYGRLYLKQ